METDVNVVAVLHEPLLDDDGRFLMGAVRWERFTLRRKSQKKKGGVLYRGTLAESVHFGAVPYVDDLLREQGHLGVSWEDPAPVIDAAVPQAPALYLSAGAREWLTTKLGQQLGHLSAALERDGVRPPYVYRKLGEEHVAWERAFLSWVQETQGHSRLIAPGIVGLTAPRPVVHELVGDRNLAVLPWLEDQVGHPRAIEPDEMAVPLEVQPVTVAKRRVDRAHAVELFRDGAHWGALRYLRWRLEVLAQLLHVAARPRGRFTTDHLEDHAEVDGVVTQIGDADRFRSQREGAIWRYEVPTDWWDTYFEPASRRAL